MASLRDTIDGINEAAWDAAMSGAKQPKRMKPTHAKDCHSYCTYEACQPSVCTCNLATKGAK